MPSIAPVLVTILAASFASACGPQWSDGTRTPGVARAAEAAPTVTRSGDPAPQGGLGAPTSDDCSAKRGPDAPADPDFVETIQPEQRVPAFDVTTLDCRSFRSGDFVGKRPFVLVFFSSWCKVCDRKMPVVRAAATKMGTLVDFIGIALDSDETWDNVAEFVERHQLSFPIVRGAHYKTFSLGYDPFGSIPVVVVVGRDGVVVDLQVGYSPFDYNRLVGAAALAERPAPRARPNVEPEP